jgi:ankyrin repeat protein
VTLLLKSGSSSGLRDADGKTALHRAVEQLHVGIVKILLEANPDLKCICDLKEKLPLDCAAKNEELVALLV